MRREPDPEEEIARLENAIKKLHETNTIMAESVSRCTQTPPPKFCCVPRDRELASDPNFATYITENEAVIADMYAKIARLHAEIERRKQALLDEIARIKAESARLAAEDAHQRALDEADEHRRAAEAAAASEASQRPERMSDENAHEEDEESSGPGEEAEKEAEERPDTHTAGQQQQPVAPTQTVAMAADSTLPAAGADGMYL